MFATFVSAKCLGAHFSGRTVVSEIIVSVVAILHCFFDIIANILACSCSFVIGLQANGLEIVFVTIYVDYAPLTYQFEFDEFCSR